MFTQMDLQKNIFYIFCILIIVSGLHESSIVASMKYLVAPISVVCFFVLCSWQKNINITNDRFVLAFMLILVFGVAGLVFNPIYEGFKDICFIASYVLPFCFFSYRLGKKEIDILFYVFIVQYVLKALLNGSSSTLSIIHSTGIYESTDCFIFGLFSVYFFYTNRRVMSIVALVLVMLSLKRVVLVGVVISIMFLYLRILLGARQAIFLNLSLLLCALLLLFLLSAGYLNDLIYSSFEVSTNYITMGRFVIFESIFSAISASDYNISLGGGVGSAYTIVEYASGGTIKHVHSDIIKILFEFGVFAFVLFFLLMASDRRLVSFGFLSFLIVIFMTDNILIYPQVMFFFFLLRRSAL